MRRQADDDAYRPNGCGACGDTGYKGRVGLFEVMPIAGEVRRVLHGSTERSRSRGPGHDHAPPGRPGCCCDGVTHSPRSGA